MESSILWYLVRTSYGRWPLSASVRYPYGGSVCEPDDSVLSLGGDCDGMNQSRLSSLGCLLSVSHSSIRLIRVLYRPIFPSPLVSLELRVGTARRQTVLDSKGRKNERRLVRVSTVLGTGRNDTDLAFFCLRSRDIISSPDCNVSLLTRGRYIAVIPKLKSPHHHTTSKIR